MLPHPDTCWRAVAARDRACDGAFVYAVRTTGIYCRPSCPSRPAKRQNVLFFPDAPAAEAAGFRACKRCRPRALVADEMLASLRVHLAEHCRDTLTLAQLGRFAGLSPAHVQRRFTAAFGLSPKAWQRACRERVLKDELRAGGDATGAIYAAGYGSGSRVYGTAATRLGMTPGAYARGGEGVAINHAVAETRFGTLLIAATARGVCWVQFGAGAEALVRALAVEFPRAALAPMPATGRQQLARWLAWLESSLASDLPRGAAPALDPGGTVFQQRVWDFLRRIPRGETRTYREVAAAIGAPTAARAVAGACAANRIAVLIPCHRVIRGDGGLSGFRWGVARKRALLAAEGALPGGARATLRGTRGVDVE
jgi:AraC family transcriptional regulator of adaptative response/methylated-DNA-[protein]-cysteine methyltransferase